MKTIGSSAFNWSGLTIVKLNSKLEQIDDNAFNFCKMESIIIPSSVTTISYNAFNITGLKVYAEATSKPVGWDSNFAGSNPAVYFVSETNPGATDGNF